MLEKRSLTCIVCPIGCGLTVQIENGKVAGVEGNTCKKGEDYARTECTNPTRTLTTTVKVKGGQYPLVSVKTDQPVAKDLIFRCMEIINGIELTAPVKLGDVILENILGVGVNIVATRNIN